MVFATHSIGLARASSSRAYSVRRLLENWSTLAPLEATSRLGEFLGELSFSAYQELGFAGVLQCEGATDVTALQQLLRLVGRQHDIVVLPLGGENLIGSDREAELSEVMRITKNVAALIDSECDSETEAVSTKRAGFAEVCARGTTTGP